MNSHKKYIALVICVGIFLLILFACCLVRLLTLSRETMQDKLEEPSKNGQDLHSQSAMRQNGAVNVRRSFTPTLPVLKEEDEISESNTESTEKVVLGDDLDESHNPSLKHDMSAGQDDYTDSAGKLIASSTSDQRDGGSINGGDTLSLNASTPLGEGPQSILDQQTPKSITIPADSSDEVSNLEENYILPSAIHSAMEGSDLKPLIQGIVELKEDRNDLDLAAESEKDTTSNPEHSDKNIEDTTDSLNKIKSSDEDCKEESMHVPEKKKILVMLLMRRMEQR
ncbi:hypothetical protein K6025_04850 [Ehrlichia sp. JZT12]